MTQNNDKTNTDGAPKEYWEARAKNELEQAKAIASARRARTTILLVFGGLILTFFILLSILLSF